MNPAFADEVVSWTARVAVAGWFGRVWIDVVQAANAQAFRPNQLARLLWTMGLLFYIGHVTAAFAFVHDWSHTRALGHTARQTELAVGIQTGIGLWINYAFSVFWLIDTARWWMPVNRRHGISRAYHLAVHGIFAFMMFNATVVFGPPMWKPVFAFAAVVLVAALAFTRRARRSGPNVQKSKP